MKKYYVGIDAYDRDSISGLCACPRVKGIVLGDLLCTGRMFAGGIAEEIRMLATLMESDKEIVFQTPLYVTSRNWDEVFSILDMLKEAKNKVHVITEDVGVVSKIYKQYPGMQVIWGRMGRDRAYRFTKDLLLELKAAGIRGMETENIELAHELSKLGITPYLIYGNLHYQTVGRICYTRYQTGKCDRDSCLSGDYRLKEKNGKFEMSVNGYLMGEELHYGNLEELLMAAKEEEAELMVYMRSYEELKGFLS